MKRIIVYLKFVEIQTKVASVFPYAIGILYLLSIKQTIDLTHSILMLIALLCIDMFTTGLNHYMDYKKAILKTGYHYEVHNPLGKGELSENAARIFLGALFTGAVVIGVLLSFRINWIFLGMGMIGFGVGVAYSFGPLPLSRTFLGELFSGVVMGFFIPFITFYASAFKLEPIQIILEGHWLSIGINWFVILPLMVLTIPLVLLIAGIMLANNTCDIEEDQINQRCTLPVMIGREKSLKLYIILVFFAVASVFIGVIFQWLPITLLIVTVIIPILFKQTKTFVLNPSKKVTFINAVKNFVLLSLALIAGLVLSILLPV